MLGGVGRRAIALSGLAVRGRHQGVFTMRGGKLGMLGLVVALFLSIMPIAGAQVADDSGESVEQQAFTDTAGSVFRGAIDELAARRITLGCNPPANTRFCPDNPVTRGQMAIFIVRAFNLGPASADFFSDDNGKVYEDAANRLAQAGLTQGCGPGRYCGDNTISRGEMAAFLSRARNLPTSSTDHFVDDNNSIFEPGINKVADARITLGCNPPANTEFCPNDNVTRGQMAAFLIRALGGGVTPPPSTNFSCSNATGITLGDCQALMTLFDATGGLSWTNKAGWAVSTTPCSNWAGVTCNPTTRRVTSLTRSGVNMTGSLPSAIGNLTGLTTLILSSNPMAGTIPTSIGKLTNLTVLDLSGNTHTGPIPSQIGSLTKLTTLDLHDNSLSQTLPPSMANLNSVQFLDLSDNINLSGNLIPIGGMAGLVEANLTNNNFGGTIPASFGTLVDLVTLDLSFNNLIAIAAGFGTAPVIELDLSDNQFNAAFPVVLTQLPLVNEMDVSFSGLTGIIPTQIGSLTTLQELDLSRNALGGAIPGELLMVPLTPGQGSLVLCGNTGGGFTIDNVTFPTLPAYVTSRDANFNGPCPA